MSAPALSLAQLVAALRKQHGAPRPPTLAMKDPFVMAVRESIAYLVSDAKRDEVLARVKAQVGLTPQALLDVPTAALADLIEDGGMKPLHRASKVQTAAELAAEMGVATLKRAVEEDLPLARRLLKRFPGFGQPGVEKVLLYNGRWKGLAPDSNALPVLLRTHGQTLCKNSQPRCAACPVRKACPSAS